MAKSLSMMALAQADISKVQAIKNFGDFVGDLNLNSKFSHPPASQNTMSQAKRRQRAKQTISKGRKPKPYGRKGKVCS